LLVLQDSGPYCDWLAVGGGGALCWHWLLLLLLQHQGQRKEKGNLTKHVWTRLENRWWSSCPKPPKSA
jgi:hypothetical protein